MNRKIKTFIRNHGISFLTILIGSILIFPILYSVCGAFKTPSEFLKPALLPADLRNFENFREALETGNLLRYSWNSLIVALFGSFFRILFAILAAYAFVYYDFKGKNFWFFLLLGTMMIPGDILLFGNYLTISELHLLNTYLACMVVNFTGASQLFMLRQRFQAVPSELREAAQLDGWGDIEFLRRILVPLCKPVIATLFIQSFIALWNSYLWPLIVTASAPDMRTVMVGITRLNSWEDENYQLVLAGVCLTLIPSLIFFFILRKSMRNTEKDGALVG